MHLPLLAERRANLETCAFCAKLCRAVCPVADADGKETSTPWGGMTAAYYLERGALPLEASHAAPAWSCTSCGACKASCELKNEVAATLLDARADAYAAGVAPPAAKRVVAEHADKVAHASGGLGRATANARRRGVEIASDAPVAILVGCVAARAAGDDGAGVAADAIVAVARLTSSRAIALIDGCCGSPLRTAGDAPAADKELRALLDRAKGKRTLVAIDAGCALQASYGRRPGDVETLHLSQLAAQHLAALPTIPTERHAALGLSHVRYHDACALGRGLGVYDPPRAVLSRLLGRAPEEFPRRREAATCAGGGGLVPVTLPETSREMARTRVGQHEAAGGGAIVTTCGSSARKLAGAGAKAFDLATLIARAFEGG